MQKQQNLIAKQVQQFILDGMRKKNLEIQERKKAENEKLKNNIGQQDQDQSSYASEKDSEDDEKPQTNSKSVMSEKQRAIEEAKEARARMGENR